MTVVPLPAIHRPPHDPTSLLCDQRVGWRAADGEDVRLGPTLTLGPAPGAVRRLTEDSGSFGGLLPPRHVAVAGEDVWLLDRTGPELLRLDPCTCTFEPVPCLGGAGTAPRQLRDPGGIAVHGDRLFVCDTGNARLQVFLLPTLALAASWAPPQPWTPTGVAVDDRGVVFVADPSHGALVRFSPAGRWLGSWTGFGASTSVAVGRSGQVYAAGPLQAYVAGPDGRARPLADDAAAVADDFPPLPVAVDARGRLHLDEVCGSPAVVDLRGRPAPPDSAPAGSLLVRSGTVTLGPLDSRIDDCTWHRVILRGRLPAGCLVDVDTATSQLTLPATDVEDLLDSAAETRLRCLELRDGQWDGLVRAVPGRYLWLRLRLSGDGSATPSLSSVEVEFPRVSLRRHLPAVYGAEPVSADLTDRYLALFDRHLRDVEDSVDRLPALVDPLATPFLDWLAGWLGEVPDPALPEPRQRALLRTWIESAALRGTRAGLWRLLVARLGLARAGRQPPPLILEHYQLRRWLELGAGRLGDQAVLWGRRIVNRSQLGAGAQVGATQLTAVPDPARDPFHVHAHSFTVFAPAAAGCTAAQRRSLDRLVARESPAHTRGHVEYVEPRFRIGVQSMIGLDAVVARAPGGALALGHTPLGHAATLSHGPGGPGPRQVGSTTVLT